MNLLENDLFKYTSKMSICKKGDPSIDMSVHDVPTTTFISKLTPYVV